MKVVAPCIPGAITWSTDPRSKSLIPSLVLALYYVRVLEHFIVSNICVEKGGEVCLCSYVLCSLSYLINVL